MVFVHHFPHLLPLPLKMGRQVVVHICEQMVWVRPQLPPGTLHCILDLLLHILPQLHFLLLVPEPPVLQMSPQAGDGMVPCLPPLHLLHVLVQFLVITGAMGTQSRQTMKNIVRQEGTLGSETNPSPLT